METEDDAFEDGELPEDGGNDDDDEPYEPLQRPHHPKPGVLVGANGGAGDGAAAVMPDEPLEDGGGGGGGGRGGRDDDAGQDDSDTGLRLQSSSSDTDSDDPAQLSVLHAAAYMSGVGSRRPRRKKQRRRAADGDACGPRMTDAGGGGGGTKFQMMAAKFQQNRARPVKIVNNFIPAPVRIDLEPTGSAPQGCFPVAPPANAAVFDKRKKQQNNVWGSILQEDTLTSEMTGSLGVGRTKKDFGSDRGAEAYDFEMAKEVADKERQSKLVEVKAAESKGLDEDLQSYWRTGPSVVAGDAATAGGDDGAFDAGGDAGDRMEAEDVGGGGGERRRSGGAADWPRAAAAVGAARSRSGSGGSSSPPPAEDPKLAAGKKRSVKDRLGQRQRVHPRERLGRRPVREEMTRGEVEDDLSIPRPGVCRIIPDLDPDRTVVDSASSLGEELAAKLSEPKTELMVGVVEEFGPAVALELFAQTQTMEREGGGMIKNGARRRTPGGLFLHLLRESKAVDREKVRQFFAQSNDQQQQQKSGGGRKRKMKQQSNSFAAELALFGKLSRQRKPTKRGAEKDEMAVDDDKQAVAADARAAADDEEIPEARISLASGSVKQPLPDLLSMVSHSVGQKSERTQQQMNSGRQPERFEEPEAPPNSVERVERTISAYDDDDFMALPHADSEDIELF